MLFKNKDKIDTLLKEYKDKMPKEVALVINKERYEQIMLAIDTLTTLILDSTPDAIFEIRQGGMNPKDIFFTAITDEVVVKDNNALAAAIVVGENFEIYQHKKGKIMLSIKFRGAYSAAPLNDPFHFTDNK